VAGLEFPLLGPEALVGRAAECDVAIADPAVSRRHALLRQLDCGWTVRDLRSGNGTARNGARVEGETPLRNGDVLTVGDSRLVLYCATRGSKRANRVSSLKRRGTAAGLAVALAVLGAKLRLDAVAARKEREARRVADNLEVAFQAGKKLVREGDWEQALPKFEQIREQAPHLHGVAEYIERASQEIPNQQLLATAQTALDRIELGAAAQALSQVAQKSQLYAQARSLKNLLDERVQVRLAEGQRALELRDPSQASASAEAILQAFPRHPDALALAAAARRARKAAASQARPTAAEARNLVATHFRRGDLGGAIAAAQQCAKRGSRECRRALEGLKEFARLHAGVEELDLRALERLLELGRGAAAGQPSSLVARAGAKVAGMYFDQAVAAKGQAQWARAAHLASRALQLAPSHSGAAALVSDLKAQARELFILAYSLKDSAPDDAMVKFKAVAAMTPEDDETHRKALNWVEKLSR
jgi:hypothetical protein